MFTRTTGCCTLSASFPISFQNFICPDTRLHIAVLWQYFISSLSVKWTVCFLCGIKLWYVRCVFRLSFCAIAFLPMRVSINLSVPPFCNTLWNIAPINQLSRSGYKLCRNKAICHVVITDTNQTKTIPPPHVLLVVKLWFFSVKKKPFVSLLFNTHDKF